MARRLTPEQVAKMEAKAVMARAKNRDLRTEEEYKAELSGPPKGRGDPDLCSMCSACAGKHHDACEHMQLIFCSCYRMKHEPRKGQKTRNIHNQWVFMQTDRPCDPPDEYRKAIGKAVLESRVEKAEYRRATTARAGVKKEKVAKKQVETPLFDEDGFEIF